MKRLIPIALLCIAGCRYVQNTCGGFAVGAKDENGKIPHCETVCRAPEEFAAWIDEDGLPHCECYDPLELKP